MEDSLYKLRLQQERMPGCREILELAQKLLEEKDRAKNELLSPASINTMEARIRMKEGFPYLRPGEVLRDPKEVAVHFWRLLKIFQAQDPSHYRNLKEIVENPGFQFASWMERLLENRLGEEDSIKELGEKGGLLLFFLVQSLKPFFQARAEGWRAAQEGIGWEQGYCPFCGGQPFLADIRQEGRRFLHCPLCATQWEYPRLRCPFCRNQDPEKLTYFEVQGAPGYRVDVCLQCRGYLKTVDAREREGSLDAEIEDFLTLHLDHLAQEEGYVRPDKLFFEVR